MIASPEKLLEAALQLSEPERLALVDRLMETLPADSEGLSMDDPGLVEELDRRWESRDQAIPWSQLRDEKFSP